jgi:hypothetical protein
MILLKKDQLKLVNGGICHCGCKLNHHIDYNYAGHAEDSKQCLMICVHYYGPTSGTAYKCIPFDNEEIANVAITEQSTWSLVVSWFKK